MGLPLTLGYAVASTDTGHEGKGDDGSYALGHPEKIIDFGYRAVHEMVVKSKAIVAECEVADVIRETGVANLSLLPCGACPPNPAELIHAERFRRIVAELGQMFDRVIFDSPPVGAVTDAAILSRLTDGTVLVAKGQHTTRDSLTRAFRQVHGEGQVNVLGCILNDLDLSKRGQYGYYYYSRYGYYYRQEPASSAADA